MQVVQGHNQLLEKPPANSITTVQTISTTLMPARWFAHGRRVCTLWPTFRM